LANVHYTIEEANHLLTDTGTVFALTENGRLLSSCFIFRNFANIWEIAAVSTIKDARKRGFAEQLVRLALYRILAMGGIPRYNVVSTNTASLALAQKCGLVEFLETYHYVYQNKAEL
jgi:predicted GNAT family acetyltransferase